MTFSLFITLLIVFLLTITMISITISHRNRISSMTGMMIAMVLGMGVGLTIGLILGILLSGNFYYSTLFSIMIGIIIGFLAGIPINLLAVLDGTLAGIMGGMMGAMLGEMISPGYQDSIIRLIFLIFVAVMIILYQTVRQEIKKSGNVPFLIIVVYILFIFGYNQVGPILVTSDPTSPSNNNHQHTHIKKLVINADEYSFTPNKIEVIAEEKVTITLNNIGKVEHDLEILAIDTELIESSSSHNYHKKGNKVHVHSMPGEKQEVSFVPLKSGEYRFVCTIPGHAESGMAGIIVVTSL